MYYNNTDKQNIERSWHIEVIGKRIEEVAFWSGEN